MKTRNTFGQITDDDDELLGLPGRCEECDSKKGVYCIDPFKSTKKSNVIACLCPSCRQEHGEQANARDEADRIARRKKRMTRKTPVCTHCHSDTNMKWDTLAADAPEKGWVCTRCDPVDAHGNHDPGSRGELRAFY